MQPVQDALALLKKQNQSAMDQQELEKTRQAQYASATPQAMKQANTANSANTGGIQNKVQQATTANGGAYAGWCLRWVDDQTGNTQRQPTAIADFTTRAQNGQISQSDKIPDGARVYFSANATNNNNGHVGLYDAKTNKFTSATDTGIQSFTIPQWEKYSRQEFLGWSPSK